MQSIEIFRTRSEEVAEQPGSSETVPFRTNQTKLSLEIKSECENLSLGESVLPEESERNKERKRERLGKQSKKKNKSNDFRGMRKRK